MIKITTKKKNIYIYICNLYVNVILKKRNVDICMSLNNDVYINLARGQAQRMLALTSFAFCFSPGHEDSWWVNQPTRVSRWKLGSMASKWFISPTYKWDILGL